jgi:hypothetical protein
MMISVTNKAQKIIFLLSIIVTSVFLIISIYSYLSVYLTFGSVPSSNDFTSSLIGNTGKSFRIFPHSAGFIIILAFLYTYLFNLFFIPILFLLRYFIPKLKVHNKLFYFNLGFTILGSLSLFSNFKIFSWYFTYILD